MRSGAGKQKGSAFERSICSLLSKWLTRGYRSDILWRSAMSGGRATVAHKKGQELAHVSGDICAVHPLGHPFVAKFFCELKFYRDLRLGNVVAGKPSPLTTFWIKACEQARDHQKIPMLIAKQNNLPILLCTNTMGRLWLNQSGTLIQTVALPGMDMDVFLLDDVLATTSPFIVGTVSSKPKLKHARLAKEGKS